MSVSCERRKAQSPKFLAVWKPNDGAIPTKQTTGGFPLDRNRPPYPTTPLSHHSIPPPYHHYAHLGRKNRLGGGLWPHCQGDAVANREKGWYAARPTGRPTIASLSQNQGQQGIKPTTAHQTLQHTSQVPSLTSPCPCHDVGRHARPGQRHAHFEYLGERGRAEHDLGPSHRRPGTHRGSPTPSRCPV